MVEEGGGGRFRFDTNYWVSKEKKSLRCEDCELRNENRILIFCKN